MARTQANRMKGDKRYKDAPRYPIIYAYEDEFKNSYNKHTKMMMAELSKEMMNMTKMSQSSSAIKKAVDNEQLEFETRDIGGDICYYCRVKGEPLWKMINETQYKLLTNGH